MSTITWSAGNHSTFLNGQRTSKSVAAAVRQARRFILNDLYGEGGATIYVDGHKVRHDERSIFTGFNWVVTKQF